MDEDRPLNAVARRSADSQARCRDRVDQRRISALGLRKVLVVQRHPDSLLHPVKGALDSRPATGARRIVGWLPVEKLLVTWVVRNVARWSADRRWSGIRPLVVVDDDDEQRLLSAAMLLSASHAMPPVRAPSPITATVCRPLPLRSRVPGVPCAHARWRRASSRRCRVGIRRDWGNQTGRPSPGARRKSWRPVSSLWT